jgi:hypothetical protein
MVRQVASQSSAAAAWDAEYAAHAHIRAAQRHLTPGGLFCLWVNAAATDIWPRHDVTERHTDGGHAHRVVTLAWKSDRS